MTVTVSAWGPASAIMSVLPGRSAERSPAALTVATRWSDDLQKTCGVPDPPSTVTVRPSVSPSVRVGTGRPIRIDVTERLSRPPEYRGVSGACVSSLGRTISTPVRPDHLTSSTTPDTWINSMSTRTESWCDPLRSISTVIPHSVWLGSTSSVTVVRTALVWTFQTVSRMRLTWRGSSALAERTEGLRTMRADCGRITADGSDSSTQEAT